MDLFEELVQLVAKLNEEEIEFALCGGLAMAVYAFPRATLDIDLMVPPESLEHTKKIARSLGFSKDVGTMRFKGGAIQIQRLAKPTLGATNPLTLDILLVTPETRPAWESRKTVGWEKGDLPVVSPQGLIALKSMRNSGQDRDDIEYLRKLIDED